MARSKKLPATLSMTERAELVALQVASEQESSTALLKSAKRVRNSAGKLRRAKFLQEVLALRSLGYMPRHTAEILGVSINQVTTALTTLRKDADAVTQMDRLDKIGVPLAVDNVLNLIQAGDKDATFKLMDGRGLFRTHKSVQAEIKQTVLELKINVVMPTHAQMGSIAPPRPGSIVGNPVTIDTVAVPERAALSAPAGIGVPALL